ncbi:hypothetical protein LLG46_06095 [bacterium]|nr:hypothetical protein [bacterium]
MKNQDNVQKLIIVLFVLSGIFLVLAAMLFPARNASLGPITRWAIAGLLMLDALFYFVAAWGLARRIRLIHWFAVLLIGGNALLSITDQVGPADLIVFMLNLIMLVLVIITGKSKKLVSTQ